MASERSERGSIATIPAESLKKIEKEKDAGYVKRPDACPVEAMEREMWKDGFDKGASFAYALAIEDVVRELRNMPTIAGTRSTLNNEYADLIEQKFGGKG